MTVDHYSRKLCQTLVFLGKHQAWFLSLGRDRLVTGPEICAIMKARTKSRPGVYRNIFQKSCKLNQALKYE